MAFLSYSSEGGHLGSGDTLEQVANNVKKFNVVGLTRKRFEATALPCSFSPDRYLPFVIAPSVSPHPEALELSIETPRENWYRWLTGRQEA